MGPTSRVIRIRQPCADQSNVFSLFVRYPGRLQFAPCLTCSFQNDLDKRTMLKVFLKEARGSSVSLDPIPTLVPFNRGASGLATLAQQLSRLSKDWIPSVLLGGPVADF